MTAHFTIGIALSLRFHLTWCAHISRILASNPVKSCSIRFVGTGTTLIEAKLNGIDSVGLEANPFAQFASSVKTDWDIDPDALVANAQEVAHDALQRLAAQGIDDSCAGAVKTGNGQTGNGHLKRLDAETEKLLIKDSISSLPLHKTLVLLECLTSRQSERYYGHLSLALANALVYSISNLRFGPEVGVDKIKEDVPVIAAWLAAVDRIAGDLRMVAGLARPSSMVHLGRCSTGRRGVGARSLSMLLSRRHPIPTRRTTPGQPGWSPSCWDSS